MLRSVDQERDLSIRLMDRYSGPTRWYYIHKAVQRVTRSRGWNITGTSKVVLVSNEIELGMIIPLIRSRTSPVSMRRREWNTTCMVQSIYFRKRTGVIMDIQVPLMIIDRRVVSVMSGVFTNRRVTHLRARWYSKTVSGLSELPEKS